MKKKWDYQSVFSFSILSGFATVMDMGRLKWNGNSCPKFRIDYIVNQPNMVMEFTKHGVLLNVG